MRLEGKHALVTAAGQGIGRASALALASNGATVLATDVNPQLLQSLVGIPRLRTAVLNVLDKRAVDDAVASFPLLNVLFNCTGMVHEGSILDARDEEWEAAFALNVRSFYWLIQASLPHLLNNGKGSIINMSSIVGVKGLPNRFIYSATKAAVLGLTKSVAADFVSRGLRCNAICPGTVDTPSLAQRIAKAPDPEKARKAFVERQPLGRLVTPEEVASTVVFLASEESASYTGEIFHINGGMTL